MRRCVPLLVLLLLLPTMAWTGTRALAQTSPERTLVARAGDGEGGFAVNAFLPEHVTIARGTTIRWEFPWWEPHTVTLGVPESGAPEATPSGSNYGGTGFHTSELLFGPGKQYEIRFTTPGEYNISCIIHPGMLGTVTVTDDAALADTQADFDARGKTDYLREVEQLKAIAGIWAARPLERTALADGTAEHTVYIAGETPKGDVQQFFPAQLRINLGDTVNWQSVTVTGHTVTFGPFPEGVPRPGNPAVDEVRKPADTYTGSGYWNSGVIGVDWQAGHEFQMTFGAPGTYVYYCIPHIDQGMVGQIIVSDAGAGPTPKPPATGTGTSDPAAAAHWLFPAAAWFLVLAIGAGATTAIVARRK